MICSCNLVTKSSLDFSVVRFYHLFKGWHIYPFFLAVIGRVVNDDLGYLQHLQLLL